MDTFHLSQSLKNIPVTSRAQYQKILVSKMESFVGRLRWKLFAIQNPGMQSKVNYGFRTSNPPPQLRELKNFEEDFFSLVKNVQFRPVYNSFQTTLSEKIKEIIASPEILVKVQIKPPTYIKHQW